MRQGCGEKQAVRTCAAAYLQYSSRLRQYGRDDLEDGLLIALRCVRDHIFHGRILRDNSAHFLSQKKVSNLMQAIDALLRRYSGRSLIEPAPDEAALGLIFASAVRAPDHGRLRPWRFIVIHSDDRAAFGELLANPTRRTKSAVSDDALERERRKAFRAPLIVVVAAI